MKPFSKWDIEEVPANYKVRLTTERSETRQKADWLNFMKTKVPHVRFKHIKSTDFMNNQGQKDSTKATKN